MATYNVTISSGTGTLSISPSVTMASNEYPVSFEWTNSFANGMFQRGAQGTGSTLTFGICDTSGNNKYEIFSHYEEGQCNWYADNNILSNVSATGLKGKSLAFYITGQYWEKARDWDTIRITTQATTSYSITATVPGGHGTVSASPTSTSAGSYVTLTISPSSGYHLAGWTINPSTVVIYQLNSTHYYFAMPASNVTVTAEFVSSGNNVILNQFPFCTVTADKTTNVASGQTVTLTATVDSGFQLSGWTSIPSVTFTNNKFTMPSSEITVTPVLTKTTGTVVHAGYYSDAVFNPCVPVYYDGTNWIECEPKYYDGSAWIDATTT